MTDRRDDGLDRIAAALAGLPDAAFRARLRARLEARARRDAQGDTMTGSEIGTATGTAVGAAAGTAARGARAGFTAVTAYAQVRDVERLIGFVTGVFGAEETHRSRGSGGGTHCELRLGDSMLMVGGGMPPDGTGRLAPPRPAALHVYVDDVDAVYRRALDAGATSLDAPHEVPYGERSAVVRDPTGNEWYIATHTGPSYSAEGLPAITPTLRGAGAAAFITFLERGLGARVEMRADGPGGVVQHAVLRIEGAALELGEVHEPWGPLHVGMYLYVPDCDALYARAVAAGARPVHAPADMPYGDRMGTVEDGWGNQWYIASHLAEPRR